jgi:hypothetical protein
MMKLPVCRPEKRKRSTAKYFPFSGTICALTWKKHMMKIYNYILSLFFFFLRLQDMGLAGKPAPEPSTCGVLQEARLRVEVQNIL